MIDLEIGAPPVNLGEQLSATTYELVLIGLRWNDRIVHLAAFARAGREPVGVR